MRNSGGCSYDTLTDEWGDWEQCMNHHESWPCSADFAERVRMMPDSERASRYFGSTAQGQQIAFTTGPIDITTL